MASDEALDPRLIFYLEHKDQIDEWLTLPELERAAADRFFESLANPLEELGSDVSGTPMLTRNIDGRWKSLLLHREDWRPQDNAGPLIGIGFEWNPGQHGFEQGYVGMRLDISVDGVDLLRASIVEGLGAVAEVAGFKKSPYWPVYRTTFSLPERPIGRISAYSPRRSRKRWATSGTVLGRWPIGLSKTGRTSFPHSPDDGPQTQRPPYPAAQVLGCSAECERMQVSHSFALLKQMRWW